MSDPTPEIISRAEAGAADLKRYYTGKPCRNGHLSRRRVVSGACVECEAERTAAWRAANQERNKANKAAWHTANKVRLCKAKKAKARTAFHLRERECEAAKQADPRLLRRCEARATGNDRYFTGKICRGGHSDYRYTSNGECVSCVRQKGLARDSDVQRERGKKYYEKNKESILANWRERYAKDRKYHAKRTADWRARNPERYKIISANWNASNREKQRFYANKRRSAEGIFTKEDIHRIMQDQKCRCAYCKSNIKKKFHIDHIRPIARGGTNWPSNLQLTCAKCNMRKRAKLPEDFARELGLLL